MVTVLVRAGSLSVRVEVGPAEAGVRRGAGDTDGDVPTRAGLTEVHVDVQWVQTVVCAGRVGQLHVLLAAVLGSQDARPVPGLH